MLYDWIVLLKHSREIESHMLPTTLQRQRIAAGASDYVTLTGPTRCEYAVQPSLQSLQKQLQQKLLQRSLRLSCTRVHDLIVVATVSATVAPIIRRATGSNF